MNFQLEQQDVDRIAAAVAARLNGEHQGSGQVLDKLVYRRVEASEHLGISQSEFDDLARAKRIKTFSQGRRVYVYRDDLMAYIDQCRAKAGHRPTTEGMVG